MPEGRLLSSPSSHTPHRRPHNVLLGNAASTSPATCPFPLNTPWAALILTLAISPLELAWGGAPALHSVPAQAGSVPHLPNVTKLLGVLQVLGHTPHPSGMYWGLTLPFVFRCGEGLAHPLEGLLV